MTSPSLTADQALDEFRAAGALLTGHFILSSGLHSPVFLQKMFVFQDPARTERLCRVLAEKAREAFGAIDIVASPALGGIVPGYETARWLGAKAIFVEREGGVFKLRRGFAIAPGARVLMVEDIITTGLSSRETLAALAEHPGKIVGAACLIDRSNGKADIGVKRVALATLDIPAYAPDALPPNWRRFRRSNRAAAHSLARPERPKRKGSGPMKALRLGVNVDHVATVRNARGGAVPDPVRAALLAIEAGADGITAHLREDRRHILDDDMRRLKASILKPLNFEMAATEAMLDIALKIRPHACCLVPEKRTERTTEGGLDVVGGFKALKPFVDELTREGIRVSMFIEPSPEALKASAELGAPVVELHTGAWCDARARGEAAKADREFGRLTPAAAADRGARARVSCRPWPRLRHRADHRRPATDRRTQHWPFPHRRGDLCRARRNREGDAHGDDRGACVRGAPALIIGIGSDLCDIERIETTLARHGERFTARCFTETEQRRSDRRAGRAASYAKQFAAKEACAKALGTGLRRGVFWRDMGVVNLPSGQPTMKLTGGAAERLKAMLPPGTEPFIHLTLTDEGPYAQAFVVIEARPVLLLRESDARPA